MLDDRVDDVEVEAWWPEVAPLSSTRFLRDCFLASERHASDNIRLAGEQVGGGAAGGVDL
jgi:hypothetical protein